MNTNMTGQGLHSFQKSCALYESSLSIGMVKILVIYCIFLLLVDNTEEEEKKVRALSKPDSPYSIQNVLWLITAMAVFYLTDFYVAVRFDDRIKRYIWVV